MAILRSTRLRVLHAFGLTAVVLTLVFWAQGRPPGAVYEGKAFTFTRIRDDVYHAVGTGNLAFGTNAVVVINDADVLLVDSHVSPAAAHVLLEELQAITTKPVRYVVNTHFHFDHSHGNQIYPASVEVIGHDFTRQQLASGASMRGRGYDRFVKTLPQTIAGLKAQLDTATSAETRSNLQRRIRIQENYKLATDAVRPVPPTIAFDHQMTLFRGGREIRMLFFGRGHTAGDVVVHLPRERVIASGDLLAAGLAYMGDAFVPEWIQTLEQVKTLDFDVILPGHGQPIPRRERIAEFQAYLTDFWAQVSEKHRNGIPAADAARQIDLRKHAANYPSITAVGADLDAVLRAFELLASR